MPIDVYVPVIMAQPFWEFTRFIWLNVARAPGGCRPLDQADQLEPIDPPVGSSTETTFTIAIYYYSARQLILILPSHGG